MMWMWFALAILFLVMELVTTQLVSIWFSAAALITGIIVAIFDMQIAWQIVVFVVLSIGALFATRPLMKKLMKNIKGSQTNLDLNIGKTAMVVETIDNIKETGAVKINGLVWTARSTDGSIIEVGEVVIFERVSGNKAFVSKMKEE